MLTVHSVADCELCETQPGAIREIFEVDPTAQVSVGDIVIDANNVVWIVTHSKNVWATKELVEFYRCGESEPSYAYDICWCRIGQPENDRYDQHMPNDPHGPFRQLVVKHVES